jgi:hypothetical protein
MLTQAPFPGGPWSRGGDGFKSLKSQIDIGQSRDSRAVLAALSGARRGQGHEISVKKSNR